MQKQFLKFDIQKVNLFYTKIKKKLKEVLVYTKTKNDVG